LDKKPGVSFHVKVKVKVEQATTAETTATAAASVQGALTSFGSKSGLNRIIYLAMTSVQMRRPASSRRNLSKILCRLFFIFPWMASTGMPFTVCPGRVSLKIVMLEVNKFFVVVFSISLRLITGAMIQYVPFVLDEGKRKGIESGMRLFLSLGHWPTKL